MKLKFVSILVFLSMFLMIPDTLRLSGCTTAVISPKAATNHVPILWKNRDTGTLANKIIFVREKPYSYTGVVNSSNSSGRQIWAGLNEMGFAIMNSVAYNLPKITSELHDLEGIVMADALRSCRTVDEFEDFLKKNLGPEFGVQTNFGVIDGFGHSAIFEVHNHGYKKLDTKQFPSGYIVNTNFSRTGQEKEGAGYLRFDRASQIIDKIRNGGITVKKILDNLSRDFGHVLLNHPSVKTVERFGSEDHYWILTKDTIDRSYTSASIVIAGKNPDIPGSVATMWVILGEPISSIALPFWVEANSTPELVKDGQIAPIYKESFRIRRIARPFIEKEKIEYIDLTKLVNREGTGFLNLIKKCEYSILNDTELFLKKSHSSGEYTEFQKKMAQRAYNALKSIR